MLKNSLKNNFVWILVLFLLFTYILSFVVNKSEHIDKRQKISTTLLNPKNVNEIESFELSNENDFIYIQKTDNFWVLLSSANSAISADTSLVYSFIKDLSNIREIYKISDNFTSDNKFGLQNESTFKIKYTLKDGSASELYFGNKDFSQGFRYFMTGKTVSVYQINNDLEKYLNTSVQYWADPYIIPRSIFPSLKNTDIQRVIFSDKDGQKIISKEKKDFEDFTSKFIDLRHGGVAKINEISENLFDCSIKIEFGNKDSLILDIYSPSTNSSDYNIVSTYSVRDSKFILYSKISIWTYNRIKEIML